MENINGFKTFEVQIYPNLNEVHYGKIQIDSISK